LFCANSIAANNHAIKKPLLTNTTGLYIGDPLTTPPLQLHTT
jgi:hypothetical protein